MKTNSITTKTINDLMFKIKTLEHQRELDGQLLGEQSASISSLEAMNSSLESQVDELLYVTNRV